LSINYWRKQVEKNVTHLTLEGLEKVPLPDSLRPNRDPNGASQPSDNVEKKQEKQDPLRDEIIKQMDPEFNLSMWKHKLVDDATRPEEMLCLEDSIYVEDEQQVC
jgi:hypothetical protein